MLQQTTSEQELIAQMTQIPGSLRNPMPDAHREPPGYLDHFDAVMENNTKLKNTTKKTHFIPALIESLDFSSV